jgi:hypothetical protein
MSDADLISRLNSPEGCERFARNVEAKNPGLALQARRKAVELKAAAHNANSLVEKEALSAVYAYERVLSERKGRKVRASRTWQMIDRHGIVEAIERAVNREEDATGYTALAQMGMQDLAFESIVVRHPQSFSPEAVRRSQERLESWAKNPG